jgi:DNA processing protein
MRVCNIGFVELQAFCPWHAPCLVRAVLSAIDATCRQLGIQVVAPPSRFARARPPPVLFVRGDAGVLDRDGVAIVGARDASAQCKAWAKETAQRLANEGDLIISGGAVGVDASAHLGAIEAGRPTVVYLGVAIDRVYPWEHHALFRRILRLGGALVSEHPPGARPFAAAHATRNRLIAAQSRAVIVVEARAGSGCRHTIAWARRLGRRVFVSPRELGGSREGLPDAPTWKGAE